MSLIKIDMVQHLAGNIENWYGLTDLIKIIHQIKTKH